MSNSYNFKEVEANILHNINLQEEYKSNPNSSKQAFATVMPPPNITGYLHIGHALVLTLQDILTRYHRMKGCDTLWQAGVDHAGIATQLVVERQLAEQGITKESLGQEGFIKAVLKWKDQAQSNIIGQIKKIGASCDFSNIAFTFSPEFNQAVNHAFVLLYEAGLIYQDYRLVNWDTKLVTAVSDLEVCYKEEEGSLFYIKYPLTTEGYIVVATTRPETMFGDVAIAVNPNDPRYTHLIGKTVIIPIINKEIPIIADDYSDMEKGSGAVKITPAHDFNDFEVGKRHNLPLVIVIDQNGKLNQNVPQEFQGLSVKEARQKVIAELTLLNNIEQVQPHLMQVPYGDRSNTVIEPLPSQQWFLNVESMAEEAIMAVKNKEITLVPSSWENLYFEWLNNIKPWCISRQLWWGHRIPVWYAEDGTFFVAHTEVEALQKAASYYKKEVKLTQETSVLDTWFSSALWPFVTLGWPQTDSIRLQKYYPTTTLVTGFDIIFFWVARMVMMGKFFLKQVPFKKVYLHSLILDSKGQKMSKTKGNVVDPLTLMDKYGTDAFRFTLANYSSNAQNIKFDEKNLENSRNFVTKIWNAYRFLLHYHCTIDPNFNPNDAKICINQWILIKLQDLLNDIDKYLNNYQFNELTSKIYHFVWDTFCDWYIEIIKLIFINEEFQNIKAETAATAMYVFNTLMHVLHPVMPFITQHLYSLINNTSSLISSREYPHQILNNASSNHFKSAEVNIDAILELIYKIRSIRGTLKIPVSSLLDLYVVAQIEKQSNLINNAQLIIKKLARLNNIVIVDQIDNSALFSEVINNNLVVGLDIKNIIDVHSETTRLFKEKNKLLADLAAIDSKFNNPNFLHKAPEQIITNFNDQKAELSQKISNIDSILARLVTK